MNDFKLKQVKQGVWTIEGYDKSKENRFAEKRVPSRTDSKNWIFSFYVSEDAFCFLSLNIKNKFYVVAFCIISSHLKPLRFVLPVASVGVHPSAWCVFTRL